MNAPAVSERGSSETGHCSNVSDSGRVCNAPRSSVLFDGVPTLTGLEGDMWASQLLTLNTSTSSTSITFDFTNPTDRSGSTFYTGVEVIEVVMFNCPAREIGTNNIQVSRKGSVADNIAVPESCDYLVRGCSTAASLYSQSITLSFSQIYPHLYIAEITFYSSITRQCSPVGPLNTSVESTLEQTSTSSSNQENTSSNNEAHPTNLASETSKIAFFSASTQEQTTINSSLLIVPYYTSESKPNVVEDRNISVSTDYLSTKSIQGPFISNIEVVNHETLSK